MDISIRPDYKAIRKVTKAFSRVRREAMQEAKAITYKHGELLLEEVRRSSPVDTGAYRDSWGLWMSESAGAEAFVWTEAPQALRLEFGFVGVDSLGRHYSQAPQPHAEPALERVSKEFMKELQEMIDRLVAG